MHQKKKDILTAVREGCRTSLQVAYATDINRDYCTKLLGELVEEGYIEIYEKIGVGKAGSGNKYRALESRYMKKEREKEPPPVMDPLVAALFGRTV